MDASGSNQNPAGDPVSFSPSRSESAEKSSVYILIAEDSRADVFLISESIQSAHVRAKVEIVNDGEKAIKFFEDLDTDLAAQCPSLLILDINLPKREGREVLQRLRASRRCPNTPVLVVTSSNSERDREDMRKLGISGYFRKPSDYEAYMRLGGIVRELLERTPEQS